MGEISRQLRGKLKAMALERTAATEQQGAQAIPPMPGHRKTDCRGDGIADTDWAVSLETFGRTNARE